MVPGTFVPYPRRGDRRSDSCYGDVEVSNNLCEQMMKHIKINLKNCLNIGSEESALDYAFMFSALESCDINHLTPESYLKGLISGLHDKKVKKTQLLPCYIRL